MTHLAHQLYNDDEIGLIRNAFREFADTFDAIRQMPHEFAALVGSQPTTAGFAVAMREYVTRYTDANYPVSGATNEDQTPTDEEMQRHYEFDPGLCPCGQQADYNGKDGRVCLSCYTQEIDRRTDDTNME